MVQRGRNRNLPPCTNPSFSSPSPRSSPSLRQSFGRCMGLTPPSSLSFIVWCALIAGVKFADVYIKFIVSFIIDDYFQHIILSTHALTSKNRSLQAGKEEI